MAGRRPQVDPSAIGFASRGDPITGRPSDERIAAFQDIQEVGLRDSKAHKGLTPQQESYCQYRVNGMSKKDAFIKTGLIENKDPKYATKYATDLENRVYVKARIGVIAAARALALRKEPTTPAPLKSEDGTTYTPDWVRQRLFDLSQEAEAVGEYSAAIKAAELIGKSIGMFSDKVKEKEKKRPNEGETDANAEPQSTFNVSFINQVFNDEDLDAGTGVAARDITPAREADQSPVTHHGRERPGTTSSLLDRLAGEIAEGVFDETEG